MHVALFLHGLSAHSLMSGNKEENCGLRVDKAKFDKLSLTMNQFTHKSAFSVMKYLEIL